MAASKSLTWHCSSRMCQAHNRREENTIHKEKHIDRSKIADNLILVDYPVVTAYHDLFDESIKAWNATQKNAGRRITSYLKSLEKANSKRRPYFETIVQIGDKNNTAEENATAAEILKDYVTGWRERNKNLVLIGAYIHKDETTTHLHLDYIPVLKEARKGPKTQVSLTGVLKNMGYQTAAGKGTGQMQWESAERDVVRTLAKQHGIEITPCAAAARREHLESAKFKEMAAKHAHTEKSLNEWEEQLNAKKSELNQREQQQSTRAAELELTAAELKLYTRPTPPRAKPNIFGKIILEEKDYSALVAAADAAGKLSYQIQRVKQESKQQLAKAADAIDKLENSNIDLRIERRALQQENDRLSATNQLFKDYLSDRNLCEDFENWAADYKAVAVQASKSYANSEEEMLTLAL